MVRNIIYTKINFRFNMCLSHYWRRLSFPFFWSSTQQNRNSMHIFPEYQHFQNKFHGRSFKIAQVIMIHVSLIPTIKIIQWRRSIFSRGLDDVTICRHLVAESSFWYYVHSGPTYWLNLPTSDIYNSNLIVLF